MRGVEGRGIAAAALLALSAEAAWAQDAMPSFGSDAELRTFLNTEPAAVEAPPPPPPLPPLPISHHDRPVPGGGPPAVAGPVQHDPPSLTFHDAAAPTPGVDAGAPVQAVGDHLVVLRRGRLFTFARDGDELRSVDAADAFAPGAAVLRDWARSLFVVGDTVAVVAFSAARGGTEMSRFRITPEGGIRWLDTHLLHRGQATEPVEARVVDGQLVTYAVRYPSDEDAGDPLATLPQAPGADRRIAADEVFVAAPLKAAGAGARLGRVSVFRCDIGGEALACDAAMMLSPGVRQVHVDRDATYVWTGTAGDAGPGDPAYLYRLPHDEARPSAVQVQGAPVRKTALGVDAAGERLNVLVQPRSRSDAAFARGFASGDPALLSLPLTRFGDGGRAAPTADYRFLELDSDDFIPTAAVAGGGVAYAFRPDGADGSDGHSLVALPFGGRDGPERFEVEAGVYRLAALGDDIVMSGAGAGLPLAVVDLNAPGGPDVGTVLTVPDAAEYLTRHGEYYRADGADEGLLVLPVGRTLEPRDLLVLRREGTSLSVAGRLMAPRPPYSDDGCRASCAAWYADGRPVFIGNRIYAVLGYELVEAGLEPDGTVRERRRLNFMPAPD